MAKPMTITVRSFAKINLGLRIGPRRADGFHELRTTYQTIGLHDVLRLSVQPGAGIEIRCANPRVPTDESNTCFSILERAMAALGARRRVVLEIEKHLPVQGGLGGASGNAVAALLALEIALKKQLPAPERMRIGAEVGSDVPLFLIGGTVLGVGRGEDVYPLPELAATPCVVATPEIAVSTPRAFADWDRLDVPRSPPATTGGAPLTSSGPTARRPIDREATAGKLTAGEPSDRMKAFGREISAWLSSVPSLKGRFSGVPAKGRGRAETLLLDLVRTGIENDFEKVVFPQYPALRDVKCALEQAGAVYASLSGSGSALYGLFRSKVAAEKAAARLGNSGIPARSTLTLTRDQYWKKLQVSGF
jgi:4-diphosphocytidyl-2-C-methyl-D-erythritol kinase